MDKRARFVGLLELLAATLLVLYCSDPVTSVYRAPPKAPGFALQPTPVAGGRTLYVPSGFNVNLFAEGLSTARFLALGPDGAVFVALQEGEIVRLVDMNGDGVADARSTVLSGLSTPSGLAFRRDTMNFPEETAAKRLATGPTTPRQHVAQPPGSLPG